MLDQYSIGFRIFMIFQFATYFMAVHKWVTTVHYDAGDRLFDLAFGAMPVLNFLYVLDYWVATPGVVWTFLSDALGIGH